MRNITYRDTSEPIYLRQFVSFIIVLSILFIVSCTENPEITVARLMDEGRIAAERGDYKGALSVWLQARNINEDNAEVQNKIGNAYLRLADFDKAKISFEKALNLEPANWRYRLELAKLELRTKDYKHAKSHLEALKDHDEMADIHIFRGDVLVLDQKYSAAEKAYLKAIVLQKDSTLAEIRLAICYLFQGRNTEADEIYSSVEKQGSNDPETQIHLANYWIIKENYPKVVECFTRAIKMLPEDLSYQRELADYYYSFGYYQGAYSLLQEIHQKHPDNRYIAKFLVDTLLLQNRYEEANALLSSLSQENFEDQDWHLLKGKYHLLVGEQVFAISHFTSVIENEPHFPAAHYFLALSYLFSGQSNLALKSAQTTLTLDPDYIEAELLLADIYYKKKEYDLSFEHAQRITQKVPENFRAHQIVGNVYLMEQKYEEALAKFATVHRLTDGNVSSIYSLALTFELSGNTKKALEIYTKLLDRNPEILDAATRYSLLLQHENEVETAKKICHSLTLEKPDNAKLYQILGDIYWNSGETGNAEKYFKKALELQPTLISSYFRLKDVYAETGNKESLIQTLHECVENNPSSPYGYIELAKFYELEGDIQLAQNTLEQAVKSNPDSPYLLSSLSWFYLEQEMNIDEAYLLSQRAYEKLPEDPAIADTLGWAYYRKKSLTRAIWTLSQAQGIAPDNPIILYHLGVVYNAQNDEKKATKYLQEALEKGLSNTNYVQIAQTILAPILAQPYK